MTTPPPLNMDVITAILTPQGLQHVQPGTLFAFWNPQFVNPADPEGPPISVGGLWFEFIDSNGVTHGCPEGSVLDVQWTPPLQVLAVSPATGTTAGGTTVTIGGTGLTAATGVSFGTTPAASFTVVNDDEITAVSPAGTGVVDITVTTPTGTSPTSPADQYTYTS